MSPTLNGRSVIRKIPAAKLERSPAHAAPIAMPTAAIRAANEVVSMPSTPKTAMRTRIFIRTTALASR